MSTGWVIVTITLFFLVMAWLAVAADKRREREQNRRDAVRKYSREGWGA